MSTEDKPFPKLEKLSDEHKQDLVKQMELYDCKMRDEDRRLVSNQNYQNFTLIFKIIITVSGAALGGSALTDLPQHASFPFLITAWIFYICSIFFITLELIWAMIQSDKYQEEMAKNDNSEANHPGNTAIFIFISLSAFCMIGGLAFMIVALAIGK